MPETQSNEKKQLLEILGAELILVPAVPYKNPNNYVKYSKKLSEDLSKKEKKIKLCFGLINLIILRI